MKKKFTEAQNIALEIWKNADPGVPKVEDARRLLAGQHVFFRVLFVGTPDGMEIVNLSAPCSWPYP